MLEFQNVGCNQEIAPYMQNVAFNNYYTYSFISRASYYAMISPQYYSFMNRFVKNWLWWYDGYVPYFHNSEQGIPSTRIATALVNKIAKKVVGGRVMYKNAGKWYNLTVQVAAERTIKYTSKLRHRHGAATSVSVAFRLE
jgi:hypothetical protein